MLASKKRQPLARRAKNKATTNQLATLRTVMSKKTTKAKTKPKTKPKTKTKIETTNKMPRAKSNALNMLYVLLVMVLASLCEPCTGFEAVVRPTKFNDLNSASPSSSSSPAGSSGSAVSNGGSNQNANSGFSLQQQQQQSQLSTGAASVDAPSQQQQQQQQQQMIKDSSSIISSNSSNVVNAQALHSSSMDSSSASQSQNLAASQATREVNNQSLNTNPNLSINPNPNPTVKINPLKNRLCQLGAQALGMQSMLIDDFALSASSSSQEVVGPQMARLNLELGGGAWCPAKPISASNSGKEWIQVKFNKSIVLTSIETQGRFDSGNGREFTQTYQLEYSRNNGLSWHRWKDYRGVATLKANDDVAHAVRSELQPPIIGANLVRILPISLHHFRTVCLRFELYGCSYTDGAPVSYATIDGHLDAFYGQLNDYTYDGFKNHGFLLGGLGQLTDGVRGLDNIRANKAFEWIGWKNNLNTYPNINFNPNPNQQTDVVIEFSFRQLRNFSDAAFHSSNAFSIGVEVFQAIDVHFGVDVAPLVDYLKDSSNEIRKRLPQNSKIASDMDTILTNFATNNQQTSTLWSHDVTSIEYEPDKRIESARNVKVHLGGRLANKLRFVLKFAPSSKWMLVSEVDFVSHALDAFASTSPLPLQGVSHLEHVAQLLASGSQAKSYDEFVAVVREHQLRRIAYHALLGLPDLSASAPASASASAPGQLQPANDAPNTPSLYSSGRIVTGPAIPSGAPLGQWPADDTPAQQTSPAFDPTATNAALRPPSLVTLAGGSVSATAAGTDTPLSPFGDYVGGVPLATPTPATNSRPTGGASASAFVSVLAVLMFIIFGALLAIAKLKLRTSSKFGGKKSNHAPSSMTGLQRHLPTSVHVANGHNNGGKLKASHSHFMSAAPPAVSSFVSSMFGSRSSAASSSTTTNGYSTTIQAPHNHHHHHHSSSLIATTNRPTRQPLTCDSPTSSVALGASASIQDYATTTATPTAYGHLRPAGNFHTTLRFNHSQPQQPPTQVQHTHQTHHLSQNQLLVLLKEPSNASSKPQAVNSQLIVGINPLNQDAHLYHQVYDGIYGAH